MFSNKKCNTFFNAKCVINLKMSIIKSCCLKMSVVDQILMLEDVSGLSNVAQNTLNANSNDVALALWRPKLLSTPLLFSCLFRITTNSTFRFAKGINWRPMDSPRKGPVIKFFFVVSKQSKPLVMETTVPGGGGMGFIQRSRQENTFVNFSVSNFLS